MRRRTAPRQDELARFQLRGEPRSPRGASRSARAVVPACRSRSPRLRTGSGCAVSERRDRRLRARFDSVPLVRCATGSQRVMSECDARSEQIDDAGSHPDSARTDDVDEHTGHRHRETEHGVVRAHDRRERATTVLIGCPALDEEPVADDRPIRCPPRRRRRRRRRARSSRSAPRRPSRRPSARAIRRSCVAARPSPGQARSGSCRSRARPRSRRRMPPNPMSPASRVSFAKTTSATLTAPEPIKATFQTISTVTQRTRGDDEPEPVRDVAPVPARERLLRAQPCLRDARDEQPRTRGTSPR